jgi:hypothetical protein
MIETRGRAKGSKKVSGSGSKQGSIKHQTKAVKQAVEEVFNDLNSSGQYLRRIADEKPALFLSLVSKLIPHAIDLEVTHKVDLSQAMLDAQARLDHPELITIDAAPPLGASQAVESLGTPAELIFDGYETTVARQPRSRRK